MNSQIENIILNVVASIITGLSVWAWVHYKKIRGINIKARLFGIEKADEIFITLNQYPNTSNLMSHTDIQTVVETSIMLSDLQNNLIIKSINEIKQPPGETTEFCIGGVDSNFRTKTYLERFSDKLSMKPFEDKEDSLSIKINKETYKYRRHKQMYSILLKFYPVENKKPVILICGQTGYCNLGTAYFMKKEYKNIYKMHGKNPFCYILKIEDFNVFGYKSIVLEKDHTNFLFNK